jgi:hypothetical protein
MIADHDQGPERRVYAGGRFDLWRFPEYGARLRMKLIEPDVVPVVVHIVDHYLFGTGFHGPLDGRVEIRHEKSPHLFVAGRVGSNLKLMIYDTCNAFRIDQ